VIWDYTFYWALLAPLFFAGKLADLAFLGALRPQFDAASALNLAVQPLLREWGERNAAAGLPAAGDGRPMLDQYRIGWFHEMNRALGDALDDDALRRRLAGNVARMRWLAAELLAHARAAHPAIGDHGLEALLETVMPEQASLAGGWYAKDAEIALA
jgi:hypothetical protein